MKAVSEREFRDALDALGLNPERGDWDSIKHFNLMMELEARWGAKIPISDVERLKTFSDFYFRLPCRPAKVLAVDADGTLWDGIVSEDGAEAVRPYVAFQKELLDLRAKGVLLVLLSKNDPPKDWKFFLDLWQHPLAVARYHGVKPWSKEHYALLRPLLGELASIGQKTITATLTDLPWNHQNFDPYRTMVEHVKGPDGKFTHDYSLFDEWVEFAQSCGLGPQIHCYTMVTWGNLVHYVDGATGDRVAEKLIPGTPEHEAFWGPFLADFERHVSAKGWLGRVHIAIDERSREELMASAAVLKKFAPGLKIQMAGNKPPSTFEGIEIHNYSQGMRANYVTQAFKDEVKVRRAKGYVTTTYICCGPPRPNTFTFSPYSEQQWLGLYAAAQGFDGMLRWAAFNWPRDPLFDTSFNPHHGSWAPGDTFLIYPGPRLSVRFENLRDSIENFEKIRILRADGAATPKLEAALAKIDFTKEAANGSEAYFTACVKAVTDAIEEASAK